MAKRAQEQEQPQEKSPERQRIEEMFARGYSVMHGTTIYTKIEDVPAEAFNDATAGAANKTDDEVSQ